MKLVPISKVKSNPDNPRHIRDDKFELLVKSIQEFPEMLKERPIVVNKDFMVLGGNMRLKACKEAGLKETYISVVDWSEKKQKEFIVKDNVGYGEWEMELLLQQFDRDDLEDWGLDIPIHSIEDINNSDEHDEWVGMPDFESKEKDIILSIKFESKEVRERFIKDKKIQVAIKGDNANWSTWYPFKNKEKHINKEFIIEE